MVRAAVLWLLLLSLSWGRCAVITGACERDVQCGLRMCCAVSLWLRGLRVCTRQGLEGDDCHPYSHKVPFPWKRQHHTCPCQAHLVCASFPDSRYRCTTDLKNIDY